MLGNLSRVIAIIGIILLMACRNEAPMGVKIEKVDIQGEWEVKNAYRNGLQTGTLDGAKFLFTPTIFSSNVPGFIFGENNIGEYRVSADSIYTGIMRPSFFIVNGVEDNRLNISTLIQGHSFEFELERINQNE
ncbi:MAG: hypothetical protein EA362_07035 [Saprospirales bacterium]|nr:MAG: hypothetical protein EA362_07035 [Saprospirales bacterium]